MNVILALAALIIGNKTAPHNRRATDRVPVVQTNTLSSPTGSIWIVIPPGSLAPGSTISFSIVVPQGQPTSIPTATLSNIKTLPSK